MAGRVLVGRVVKPHGLRGEVVVRVLSDLPDRIAPGIELTGEGRTLQVAATRWHSGRLLVQFEDVGDRSGAEALRGLELEAPAVDVSDQDTYLVSELVGMRVRHDGADLGTVSAAVPLPPTASYDLLEVTRPDGTTWLLPAADEFVEAAEDAEGEYLAVTSPPEGLLDLE